MKSELDELIAILRDFLAGLARKYASNKKEEKELMKTADAVLNALRNAAHRAVERLAEKGHVVLVIKVVNTEKGTDFEVGVV